MGFVKTYINGVSGLLPCALLHVVGTKIPGCAEVALIIELHWCIVETPSRRVLYLVQTCILPSP